MMLSVPAEATAFLGAVGTFFVLLMVFYLYLTKKVCFTKIGGFECCDYPIQNHKDHISKDLGTAFAYDDCDSSTDSEDEVIQRLQQSASQQSGFRKLSCTHDLDKKCLSHETSVDVMGHVARSISQHGCQETSFAGQSGNLQPGPIVVSDLISLAEEGNVCKARSTSPQSSETSSQDTGDRVTRITSSRFQHFTNSTFQKSEESLPTQGGGDNTDQDDPLFDVSDMHTGLEDQEPASGTRCGALEVAFAYDDTARKVIINVIKAHDLPSRDRGGANHYQIRLLMLPHKRQKHKTKIRQGCSPKFKETFMFNRIPPEELTSMGMRFRLYSCERMRREHLVGESVISFNSVRFNQENSVWLILNPRANLAHADSKTDLSSLAQSDSTGSLQSMQHGGLPELLLGLSYNGTTGRLTVEVIKGSQFRNAAISRVPDTYVKLSLVSSSGQEIARSKTSVRRGQPNPLFKESFVFQVALFQLPDVTLMVSIYSKRSMKRKEMIGWFSLGLNSSGEEELAHWNDMRENKGEQVCRWHVLLES